ncbi:LANO_0B08372g1_1 [Lachancea nothofagi CBS 11611]|uniref:LANO_0B08372g1_1 n=1 Tax=Lachancea nothofagi CBS 11611 TaxID=1266666 RepID=A0A1G4J0M8_9SACH|nr:LANO_0B08372g1_1 [Lachancea nothofagi CBS 11611]
MVDLTKLNPEQLSMVKQQFDQELQHFSQSLQALNVARNKFRECKDDIASVSKLENQKQELLVPLSGSLYVKGHMKDTQKFMVDIGTGYYVEKSDLEATEFYDKKIAKLNQESVQIQNIIKEKSQSSMAIEGHIRQAAIKLHEEQANSAPQGAQPKAN